MLQSLQDWSPLLYAAAAAWVGLEILARALPKQTAALQVLRTGAPWVAAVRAGAVALVAAAAVSGLSSRFRFVYPETLWLLVLIPLVAGLSMRSLAGLGGGRRAAAVALRCLCLLLLIAALADIQRRRVGDDCAVIVLLDTSSSVPDELQHQAVQAINAWAEKAGPRDSVKVITFADDAQTETPFLRKLHIYDLANLPKKRDRTDLAGAIRMAVDSFPPDTRRRLVILSDGNQTVGDARAEAVSAAARGIPIDTVTLKYGSRNEVLVDSVRAPATAGDKETVDITVGIRTLRDCRIRLHLFDSHDGDREQKISDAAAKDPWIELDLEGGGGPRGRLNTVVITRPVPGAGLHRWRVEIQPVLERFADGTPTDYRAQNNVGAAATAVVGTPQILLVTPDPAKEQRLIKALSVARLGIGLTVVTPTALPPRAELFHYDAVVFSNVPAAAVPDARRAEIEQYVKDTGGGFVMIGGEESFGAGEWRASAVEKVLPVSMEVKNFKVRQMGALVLVMHSSEMAEGNFWAEQVATEAIKAMTRLDEVGVLDYEGGNPTNWVVPLQQKLDEARILGLLGKMSMGDMPDLDAIIAAAHFSLAQSKAANKHIIVISDGDPRIPTQGLIDKLKADAITVTCVAVTPHQISPPTQDLIEFKRLVDKTRAKGRGNFFIVDDFARQRLGPKINIDGTNFDLRGAKELPKIFLQETKLVRRPLLVNVPDGFQPMSRPTGAAPIDDPVYGLDLSNLRRLRGFVLTTVKPGAFVPVVHVDPLAPETPDPILAHWRYGIGKSVAWTSDAKDVWAADWVNNYPEYERIWEQIIRWVQRPREDPDVSAVMVRDGDSARLTVTAVDARRRVRTDVAFTAGVLAPDGTTKDLPLAPTAAGGYTGTFRLGGKGTYFGVVRYKSADGLGGERYARVGLDVAYDDEYRTWSANPALMTAVTEAAAPGGKALVGEKAGEFADLDIFRREGLAPAESWQSLSLTWEVRKNVGWTGKLYDLIFGMPLPAWLAVVFLLDVMVRRVVIDPAAVGKWLRRMLGRLMFAPPAADGANLDALKVRRREVDAALPQGEAAAARPAPRPPPVIADVAAPPPPPPPAAAAPAEPMPSSPSAPPPSAPPAGESASAEGGIGRLRAAKKRAREDLDNRKNE